MMISILMLAAAFFYGIFCLEVWRRFLIRGNLRLKHWLFFFLTGWIVSPITFFIEVLGRAVEWAQEKW